MHVAFLILDFSHRTSGGIGTYVRTMANALTARGRKVTVVCAQRSKIEDASFRIETIDAIDVPREKRRIAVSDLFLQKLFDIHQRDPIELVEATDWGMEAYACSVAKAFPCIVRFHTPNSMVEKLNEETRFADSRAVNTLENAYFNGASALSSPSRAMVSALERTGYVGCSRITVIPNPIDLSEYACGGDTKNAREASQFVLGYFGRVEMRKGGLLLAESLANLFPKQPSLNVDFIGPNTRAGGRVLAVDIQKMLSPHKDRIRFLGHQSGKDKVAAIRRCDAIVCPSPWENFPYACLEAQACGKTVIAFRGSGFDEMIVSGKDGVLVDERNPQALADAIEGVMQSNGSMGEEAARSVQKYSLEMVLPDMERFYQWTIQQSAS